MTLSSFFFYFHTYTTSFVVNIFYPLERAVGDWARSSYPFLYIYLSVSFLLKTGMKIYNHISLEFYFRPFRGILASKDI